MATVLSSGMMTSGVYRYERNRLSHEFFSPGPLSRERTATAASAVFNLVKTIIGGGILSLPFAFDKCGIVLAVLFMIVSAVASTFTLYVIVSCSRRGSAASYEEVVRKALGQRAAVITVVLLVMLTFLTLVAYVIFIKDLVGSLGARYLFARALTSAEQNGLTIFCVALISPFLFVRSMDALRFTSIFSLIAVVVLAIAITVRAVESLDSDAAPQGFDEDAGSASVKLLPSSWKDPVYAFPIISVSFLCHFNVLPVYSELHKPTRKRLKRIVASTMFSTWVFYMIVGVMGYLFAYRMPIGVQGDILNNFSDSDKLMNLGRFGLLVTIMLSLPIICQPCRNNLTRLAKYAAEYAKPLVKAVSAKKKGSEHQPLLPATSRHPAVSPSALSDTSSDASPTTTSSIKEKVGYVLVTVGIMASATACALLLPGVVVVWNFMGSTVGILISYVLPCASYVRIRAQKPNSDKRKLTARVILAVSSVLCVACSVQSIASIFE